MIEQKWIDARKGMNRLSLTVPDSLSALSLRLSTVIDFKEWSRNISVAVENPDADIKVHIEHLRDRITPLSPETVTVKVTDAAGKGVGAALILDMYSKALDNLASQSWTFSPAYSYIRSMVWDNNLRLDADNSFAASYKSLTVPSLGYPAFNFYGMSWTGGYGRGAVLMKNLSIRGAATRSVKMESASDDFEEEVAAADEVVVSALEGSTAGVALSETVVTAYGSDGGAANAVQEQYRPAEVPLAFFAPMLSTGADGSLTYSFTVPDANTTWVLNALAYTDALATGLDIREVIASKPVMVEPNMPRFLRTGDVADIRATVMNASDTAASVTT
ncbi:MAG: hypothetical protein K2I25_03630, partial [Muribaculaceae bacterium]|nr:hypothetical protein [Muribaculaceae bacterium]